MKKSEPRGFDEAHAAVYDTWYGVEQQDASTDEAVACLADLAAGGRVLELAIGTGRIALPLAETGLEVHGIEASERDIRDFALERLADFKAPRKIVILDEIPKGATGKMQRIGLAEKLGLVEGA